MFSILGNLDLRSCPLAEEEQLFQGYLFCKLLVIEFEIVDPSFYLAVLAFVIFVIW